MPKGGTETTRSLDAQVGANLRAVRMAAGVPMRELAALLGVSVTQISEYEIGKDRIGAGALFLLAEAFGVRVGRFYAGLVPQNGVAEEAAKFEPAPAPEAAQATLLTALAVAPLKAQRRAIRGALKALEPPAE